MRVQVVFFDVGETLVDETRYWALWADWLGVPLGDLLAARDATIARREHHRRAFAMVAPHADPVAIQRERHAAGEAFSLREDDLYPDARACLAAVRGLGVRVGFASNAGFMNAGMNVLLGHPGDVPPGPDEPPAEKPDPLFFSRLVERAGCPPASIAYVGDRVDTDVLPALGAGMVSVFLKRGPWGAVHATWPEAAHAHACVDSLLELPAALERIGATR